MFHKTPVQIENRPAVQTFYRGGRGVQKPQLLSRIHVKKTINAQILYGPGNLLDKILREEEEEESVRANCFEQLLVCHPGISR